jgi:hypothetical protein
MELSHEFWRNDIYQGWRSDGATIPFLKPNKLRPDDPITLQFLKPNTPLVYCFVRSIDKLFQLAKCCVSYMQQVSNIKNSYNQMLKDAITKK